MRVEAAAAGIGPVEFWDLTFHEINIQIRGFGRRLKYLNYFMALNAGPIASSMAKGNPGRDMVRAAQAALDDI